MNFSLSENRDKLPLGNNEHEVIELTALYTATMKGDKCTEKELRPHFVDSYSDLSSRAPLKFLLSETLFYWCRKKPWSSARM